MRVVAAVIARGAEILVSLRHPKAGRPSQWEFPGGKLEPGESEQQALARELVEELGVRAEVGLCVRRHTHSYPETDVEIGFYACTIVEGVPEPRAMREIRWVHRKDLGELDFLVADRPFVGELVASAPQFASETTTVETIVTSDGSRVEVVVTETVVESSSGRSDER